MLDSPDLARDPPKVVQQPHGEAEKAAHVQRDIELDELRKQLERNQEVSQSDQDVSEKAENHGRHSPETDKGSKRRKVQWAGFSEEDHTRGLLSGCIYCKRVTHEREDDRETHRAHSGIHSLTRPPHISLPMQVFRKHLPSSDHRLTLVFLEGPLLPIMSVPMAIYLDLMQGLMGCKRPLRH